MKLNIIDNTEQKRFETEADGSVAFIDYIINKKGVMYLTHTEVPKPLEGKGVGTELVKYALNQIEKRELKLVPICPFVAAYLRRHPEWQRLLAENFNV